MLETGLIYVLDDDGRVHLELQARLARLGWRVQGFVAETAFLGDLLCCLPEAALIATSHPQDWLLGLALRIRGCARTAAMRLVASPRATACEGRLLIDAGFDAWLDPASPAEAFWEALLIGARSSHLTPATYLHLPQEVEHCPLFHGAELPRPAMAVQCPGRCALHARPAAPSA